jgi:hypothetical protein
MYLAKKRIYGKTHYSICESYPDGDCIRHRELCAIGTAPWEYIEYPGGNAFFINEILREKVREKSCEYDDEALEDLFWPFVDPYIAGKVGHFRCRQKHGTASKKLSSEDESIIHETVHIFDKRRMHYLRCGRSSQVNMNCVPAKLFKALAGRSRDEIEHLFMNMECHLRSHELKTYVYVVFDVEKWFKSVLARKAPEMLDQRDLDEFFLTEICRLNGSESFWAGGEKPAGSLHNHLIRYVIMFFDNDFTQGMLLNDYARQFMNQHRQFRGYPVSSSMRMDQVSAIFEISEQELDSISKIRLTRVYRRLARKHHPDRGGDQKKFVELSDAYRALMRKKGF